MARKNIGLSDELKRMDPDYDPDAEPSMVPTPAPELAPPPDIPTDPSIAMAVAIARALGTTQQDALEKAIRATKDPLKENPVSPDVSVYNPYGERDHPRPGLKCEMYWGVYDEREPFKPAIPLYRIEDDSCTYEEQVLLNAIEPWEGLIDRNDDRAEKVKIVASRHEVTGAVTRMVLAFRRDQFARDQRNMLPSLRKLATQVVLAQHGQVDEVLTAGLPVVA